MQVGRVTRIHSKAWTEVQMGQVTRIDYHLSSTDPAYIGSTTYESPTPLMADVHEGFEVGVLLTGAQERHSQDLVQLVQPGDIWLCGTWEPHGWRVLLPGTQNVVCVFLAGHLGDERFAEISWLDLFAADPGHRPRVADASTRARVLALGQDMLSELMDEQPGWGNAIRLDLLRALFAVSRKWSPPAAGTVKTRARPTDLARVMPALRLVHSSPARRVSLDEAAQECTLSRARFCMVFRSTMGLTFGEFCLRARLARAAHELLSGDSSTETIAEQTGFSDASHFHHNFLKRYGCTPAHYRRQGRLVQDAPGLTAGLAGQ
ncbi:MAG: AraC family transcriptional regulator [Armatimonadota bacterium]|jgi:AraC-like DNA-binding protein